MKLAIASNKRYYGNSWTHIDINTFPDLDARCNVTNLPFKNEKFELVYASHILEYFDMEEAYSVLLEWKRVLKPKGIMRIAVPNFEIIARLYLDSNLPLSKFLGPLYGKINIGINNYIYHKTAYDFYNLKQLLENIGMKNIRMYNWRHTDHTKIDDHSQAYIPHMDKKNGTLISLNVEGNKGD